MRSSILLAASLIALTPAAAQKPSSESTPPPEKLLAEIGRGVSDEALATMIADAAHHPLGTLANPVRAGGPKGEETYLARLRCSDGSEPQVGKKEEGGVGAFGTITGRYHVDCASAAPGTVDILFDMYHEGYEETAAPAGFTLAAQ